MARKADPNKKTKIVQAATKVFARKGYAGTIMSQVAEEAGTGKGTLYEYFKSKEDLFFAVFEQLMADSADLITSSDDTEATVAGRLETLAATLIENWTANLELYALVMEFWSATATLPCRQRFKTAFQEGYAEFRKQVGALIQKGIDQGAFVATTAPEALAAALIGSWDALLLQAWLDKDFDPLAASREHMRVVLKGLQAPAHKEL